MDFFKNIANELEKPVSSCIYLSLIDNSQEENKKLHIDSIIANVIECLNNSGEHCTSPTQMKEIVVEMEKLGLVRYETNNDSQTDFVTLGSIGNAIKTIGDDLPHNQIHRFHPINSD